MRGPQPGIVLPRTVGIAAFTLFRGLPGRRVTSQILATIPAFSKNFVGLSVKGHRFDADVLR